MKVELAGNLERGSTALEIVIALGIITVALSSMILISFSNQSVAVDNEVNNDALIKTRNIIDKAQSAAADDFIGLVGSSSFDGIFNKSLLVKDVNNCRKSIIASTSWQIDNRRQLMEFKSEVVDIANALKMGGDCGPEDPPSTNWQDIICKDQVGEISPTWDFSPSGPPATGIDLIKKDSVQYAIISERGSAAGDKDLWIVNVTNRTTLQSAISSTELTDKGANDVDAVGNFAFIANNDVTKQLIVADISDLAAPSLVASVSLNAVGANSEAQKIFYYNNKVYVGTNYMVSYDEFQIFDVTDPVNPSSTPLGTYNVNHNIYSITVRDEIIAGTNKTLAYLAVSATDPAKPKMIVLDVTVPGSITQIGSFNPTPGSSLYGTALYVLGENAYLGRQRGTGSNHDLFVLNISDPNSVSLSDSALLGMGAGNEVRKIIVSSPLLFMITSDNNEGFQVWNVDKPTDISKVGICKYPQEAMDMEFDGNFVYVVNRSQKALRVIYDSANPFP